MKQMQNKASTKYHLEKIFYSIRSTRFN